MSVHTYPAFFKILYRFGNIPVSFFLLVYLYFIASHIDNNLLSLIPFLITLLLLYFLNRLYIMLYKILPYRIEADDEKMFCSEFLLSPKTATIYYKDIESLTGGIYDGKMRGVMKVCDGKNKICIGFYNKIRNAKALETLILSKVRKEIYDDVLARIGERHKTSFKKKAD